MATAAVESDDDDLWDFTTPGGLAPVELSSGGKCHPATSCLFEHADSAEALRDTNDHLLNGDTFIPFEYAQKSARIF